MKKLAEARANQESSRIDANLVEVIHLQVGGRSQQSAKRRAPNRARAHLHHDANNDNSGKHPGSRSPQLIVALEGEPEGHSKALDGHDRDGPGERADGDVDEGVCAALRWGHAVDHVEAEAEHKDAVGHEPCTMKDL